MCCTSIPPKTILSCPFRIRSVLYHLCMFIVCASHLQPSKQQIIMLEGSKCLLKCSKQILNDTKHFLNRAIRQMLWYGAFIMVSWGLRGLKMGTFLSWISKKIDFFFSLWFIYLLIDVSGTLCKERDIMEGDEARVLPRTCFLPGFHQVCIMRSCLSLCKFSLLRPMYLHEKCSLKLFQVLHLVPTSLRSDLPTFCIGTVIEWTFFLCSQQPPQKNWCCWLLVALKRIAANF